MAADINVTGSVNLVEVVSTLNHVVEEMGRLGRVIEDECKENRTRFEGIKEEVTQCRTELMKEISAIDKEQVVTAKDVRMLSAKVAGGVSAATAIILWLLKSGALAAML